MTTVKIDTVTRDDLRHFKVGESVVYELPNPQKCMSVRAMTAFLKKSEGMQFSCSGSTKESTIQVTRKA